MDKCFQQYQVNLRIVMWVGNVMVNNQIREENSGSKIPSSSRYQNNGFLYIQAKTIIDSNRFYVHFAKPMAFDYI
jgi:hypothetical protein